MVTQRKLKNLDNIILDRDDMFEDEHIFGEDLSFSLSTDILAQLEFVGIDTTTLYNEET